MSENEKSLPKPPTTPFGRKRWFEEDEGQPPLMADKMAAAMAEGKLDEFLKTEMPDNEYARSLTMMMLGMTGMMHPQHGPESPSRGERDASETMGETRAQQETPPPPPDDVMQAVSAGNLKELMELLGREHRKRTGDTGPVPAQEKGEDAFPHLSDAEKEALDSISKIASENKVSVDWVVLRALRFYIEEYQKSGRL